LFTSKLRSIGAAAIVRWKIDRETGNVGLSVYKWMQLELVTFLKLIPIISDEPRGKYKFNIDRAAASFLWTLAIIRRFQIGAHYGANLIP
jgi:hypothetical protein